MNKSDLQASLRAHGEEPPESWTVIELRSRLAELDPSKTEPAPRGGRKTELQVWVGKINKARAKKAHLIELCTQELSLVLTGNETVSTLERLALQRASIVAEPMAADLVGFGKHAALEYQEINRYQPSYREWVLKTDSEERECDWRLRRLARWLRANPVDKDQAENKPAGKSPSRKKGGSSVAASSEISAGGTASSTTSSASAAPVVVDKDMIAILQNLTGTIQNLQEKVAEMEESRERERPRKKTEGYKATEEAP